MPEGTGKLVAKWADHLRYPSLVETQHPKHVHLRWKLVWNTLKIESEIAKENSQIADGMPEGGWWFQLIPSSMPPLQKTSDSTAAVVEILLPSW